MKSAETALSAAILARLSDGVMAIDGNGRVLAFNAAAEAILGIPATSAFDAPFAELFLSDEKSEAFVAAVLEAVYHPEITHAVTVPYTSGSRQLHLAMKTARLHETVDVVVIIFSDVTELTRLSQELKTKHEELQKAFLDIEEGNLELRAAAKRIQFIGTFVILLVLGAAWLAFARGRMGLGASKFAEVNSPKTGQSAIVKPQELTETITLAGTIRPLEVVNVTSPFTGKVAERLVQYGQTVRQGAPLLRMDTSDVSQKLREAIAAETKAEDSYQLLSTWEKSPEVSRAKRSQLKAKMALVAQRQLETETEALFQKGIVSQSERENATKQRMGTEMDMQAADEELAATLQKGNARAVQLAKAELLGAGQRRADLEKRIQAALVLSPVSGTVLAPASSTGADKPEKLVEKGVSFEEAEVLLSVGNLEGVSLAVDVNEMEVLKIREGQPAKVSGEAFSDVTLDGRVKSVSGIADTRPSHENSRNPGFEVVVAIEQLTGEAREKVRIGMSAKIEIVVSDQKDALVVPFAAVELIGPDRYVKVRDRGREGLRRVKVETGLTSEDGVEVVKGLTAGQEVVW